MTLSRRLKYLLFRIGLIFVPGSRRRKELRAYFPEPFIDHKFYGRIYVPVYSSHEMSSEPPKAFNADGEPLDALYLREHTTLSQPYFQGSKYFIWDRYNVALKKHFYGGGIAIVEAGMQKKWAAGTRRWAFFREPESIDPNGYHAFEKFKTLHETFENVLTFSETLLEKLPNAKFFPGSATAWYGNEIFKGERDPVKIDGNVWQIKDKLVSMICSNKAMTAQHLLRQQFADAVLRERLADVFGGYAKKPFPFKSATLQKYRYQIVIENESTPYYFSEKIIDCFASMTIPIYLGATRISEFFNPDGIIFLDKNADISQVLRQCLEADYLARLPAVKENFERSRAYWNTDDLLYEIVFKNRDLLRK